MDGYVAAIFVEGCRSISPIFEHEFINHFKFLPFWSCREVPVSSRFLRKTCFSLKSLVLFNISGVCKGTGRSNGSMCSCSVSLGAICHGVNHFLFSSFLSSMAEKSKNYCSEKALVVVIVTYSYFGWEWPVRIR